jgi:hypothetical protein
MVLVSAVGKALIQDARDFHLRILQGKPLDGLDTSFCHWLLPRHINAAIGDIVVSAANAKGAAKTFRTVATLGFGMEDAKFRKQFQSSFRSGVSWLVGRSTHLEGAATSLISDGIAFLGTIVGLVYLGDARLFHEIEQWREQIVTEVEKSSGLTALQKSLYLVANVLATNEGKIQSKNQILPEVVAALKAKGILKYSIAPSLEVLESARRTDYERGDICTAAFRLAVLDWLSEFTPVVDLKRVTSQEVADLLHRLQGSFLRWVWENKSRVKGAEPRKWHVENEYHVQALLWVVLSPIFPDLKEEEYLASIAHLQPRADLCIPSLKLVVEVKFWYARQKPQDLIEQISADANLYLQHGSDFNEVIAVVWDDESRVEDHDLFRQGLKRIRGIRDVVFIQKPSVMRETGAH